jgi:hypothetical protein
MTMGRSLKLASWVLLGPLLVAPTWQVAHAEPPASGWDDQAPPLPAAPPAAAAPAPALPSHEEVRELLRHDPEIGPRYRQGRGMMIGGGVGIGVGVVTMLIGGLTAAFSDGWGDEDDIDPAQARRDLNLGLGAVIGGAVVIAAGATVLAFGAGRRRQAIDEATRRVQLGMGPRGLALRF